MQSHLLFLFSTGGSFAPLFLRLALGAMIFAHGAQKLLGWFGGYGFRGTMQWFTGSQHLPWILGLAAIVAEFFGGLALLAGAGTRVAAIAVGVTLLVAAATVHWSNGFFMNWSGGQKGEGLEFFLLALGMAVALAITGGGAWSVDGALTTARNLTG